MNKIRKPENTFLLILIVFSIAFFIYFRPLQSNDENHAFQRVYGISQGLFIVNNQPLPVNKSDTEHFGFVPNKPHTLFPKSVAEFVGSYPGREKYDDSFNKWLKTPLNKDETVILGTTQFDTYAPVAFLPQVLATAAGKLFNLPAVILDYLARFAVFVTYALFMYFSIKTIPVKKWAVVAVGLLPTMISLSIGMNADIMSIGPVVLFLSILIRSYFEERSKKQNVIDIVMLSSLAVVAALSKPSMIAGLILIPLYFVDYQRIVFVKKFGFKSFTWLKIVATSAPLIAYGAWSSLTSSHHLGLSDIYLTAIPQLSRLKTAPIDAVKSFVVGAWNYFKTGMGLLQSPYTDTNGALDVMKFNDYVFHLPYAIGYFILISTFVFIFVGYRENKKRLTAVSETRFRLLVVFMFVAVLGIVAATLLAQWITWTPTASDRILGIQARYYMAAFFILGTIPTGRLFYATEKVYKIFSISSIVIILSASVLALALA